MILVVRFDGMSDPGAIEAHVLDCASVILNANFCLIVTRGCRLKVDFVQRLNAILHVENFFTVSGVPRFKHVIVVSIGTGLKIYSGSL